MEENVLYCKNPIFFVIFFYRLVSGAEYLPPGTMYRLTSSKEDIIMFWMNRNVIVKKYKKSKAFLIRTAQLNLK